VQAVHLNPSPSGTPQPLPDLSALKRLVSLDLSENLFLRVPAGLSRLQALESLTFRDNSRLTVRLGGCHGGFCCWLLDCSTRTSQQHHRGCPDPQHVRGDAFPVLGVNTL